MARLYGAAKFEWNDHNLVAYSEEFGEWSSNLTPVLTSGETDPLGGTNAYLIEDDNAGGIEYVYTEVQFTTSEQKAITLFVKEGDSAAASGSVVRLRDTTAAATRGQIGLTWSAGAPVVTYSIGTKLFEREWLNGWWRLAFLSQAITHTNDHLIEIWPALTSAETGDLRAFGVTVLDVTTAGGYVKTCGDAIAWDGSSVQTHELRVPLQKILLAGSVYRVARESADKKVREVTSIGSGVNEITALVRYEDSPSELNEMIRAGVRGFPLVYIPDDTDLDTAYEMELLEPGESWVQQMDEHWVVFQETSLPVRLRRMDGGNLSGLVS